jgi:hypothetical protein
METRNSKLAAFFLSAVLTIIILGSMIIMGDQNTAFKTFLNSLTGHHWVTKSVFAAVLFPLFSAVFFFVLRFDKARKLFRANNVWGWSLLVVAVTGILFLANLLIYLINYLFL